MNTLKTYAETRGEPPFNWLSFLTQGSWTARELDAAVFRARHWPTCACGNQCASIPRNFMGCPFDPILGTLGAVFFNKIIKADDGMMRLDMEAVSLCMTEALGVFFSIEARSSELIEEIDQARLRYEALTVDNKMKFATMVEAEAERELAGV